MDDSERSYGYSEDIYHGRRGPGGDGGGPRAGDQEHWERSYEYGAEQTPGGEQPGDLSPEEAAVHVVGPDAERGVAVPRGRGGRFGRHGDYESTESWTWDVGGPFRGHGPEGYRRSDQRIQEDVCERLTAHGRLDARGVRVTVEAGDVTLEGTVPDRRSKRLAERVADSVRGVEDVHNRLRLAGRGHPRDGAHDGDDDGGDGTRTS